MALARLVLFAKTYWKGDYDSDQLHIPATLKPPKKHASDAAKEAWNENEEAVLKIDTRGTIVAEAGL